MMKISQGKYDTFIFICNQTFIGISAISWINSGNKLMYKQNTSLWQILNIF